MIQGRIRYQKFHSVQRVFREYIVFLYVEKKTNIHMIERRKCHSVVSNQNFSAYFILSLADIVILGLRDNFVIMCKTFQVYACICIYIHIYIYILCILLLYVYVRIPNMIRCFNQQTFCDYFFFLLNILNQYHISISVNIDGYILEWTFLLIIIIDYFKSLPDLSKSLELFKVIDQKRNLFKKRFTDTIHRASESMT